MDTKLVDEKKVFDVLKKSSVKILEKAKENLHDDLRYLEKLFPDVVFDKDDFTFKDKYGNVKQLSKLLGSPYFKPNEHGTRRFVDAQDYINEILNTLKDAKHASSDEYMMARIENLNESIKLRARHCASRHSEFCAASDALVGTYKVRKVGKFKEGYHLKFSNDPIDVFMKSSGQCWETESCERVGGQFESGIYSDIEWGNVVVFAFRDGIAEPFARIMVRSCKTGDGTISFGIEPRWYHPYDGLSEKTDDFYHSLRSEVERAVRSKGFPLDYKTCKTPYVYGGYSDKAGQGRARVDYGPDDDEEQKDDIDFAEMFQEGDQYPDLACVKCDLKVYHEWDIEREDNEELTTDIIMKFYNEREGKVYHGYYMKDTSVTVKRNGDFLVKSGMMGPACPRCGTEILMFTSKTGGKDAIEKNKKIHAMITSEFESAGYKKFVEMLKSTGSVEDFCVFMYGAENEGIKRYKGLRAYKFLATMMVDNFDGNKYSFQLTKEDIDHEGLVVAYVAHKLGKEHVDEYI